MISPTTLLLATASLAAASTIPVLVGKTGLTFEPNVIHANQGDVIEFQFFAKNHSVVAGDFTTACRPASSGGFFSGFFPTAAGVANAQVFRVTVSHTNPQPIYCAQNTGQHCKNGMVAVINPSSSLSFDAYSALARNAGNASVPATGPFGGQVAPNQSASSSSSSSSAGSSFPPVSTTTTTQAGSFTTTATATETETGGGGGASSTQTQSATTTSSTGKPTGTGNAAAGVAVPVAGLLAVAFGALFV